VVFDEVLVTLTVIGNETPATTELGTTKETSKSARAAFAPSKITATHRSAAKTELFLGQRIFSSSKVDLSTV
jgi:hypothetical protein